MRVVLVALVLALALTSVSSIKPELLESTSASKSSHVAEQTQSLGSLSMNDLAHLEEATGRWNIMGYPKETVHETITQNAYDSLPAAQRAYFNVKTLQRGVRWNDMPVGSDKDDGLSEGYLDLDTWMRIFMFTKTPRDLIYSSHYGCLSHIHSMAPVLYEDSTKPLIEQAIFTNREVLGFIYGQMKYWLNEIMKTPNDKERVSWQAGKIAHQIQDSFPRGHTARTDPDDGSSCGKVIIFQSYSAQAGNEHHADSDYSPAQIPKDEHPRKLSLTARYGCAKADTAKVLGLIAACLAAGAKASLPACDFDKTFAPYLNNNAFAFGGADIDRRAGGAIVSFAKPNIDRDPAFRKDEHPSGVQFYVPQGKRFWKDLKGKQLCGPKDTTLSKYVNKCFLYPVCIPKYSEGPFNLFYNPVA